jgi:aromatic-amino-acid transaminase
MHPSPFATVPMANRDPILGLNEAFASDPRPGKVNLGVGVYGDENGRIPLLAAVRQAESILTSAGTPRTYLPIEGSNHYKLAVKALVFGQDASVIEHSRIATVQTLGGTGALRTGADFIKRFTQDTRVFISDPSWENHRALFEAAGFTVETYPYYDPQTHDLKFDAMVEALKAMPEGSVVVLHACCHNPTGVDLSETQWTEVVALCQRRKLLPFLDMAYQGFGASIEADAGAVRQFAQAGLEFLVANSFSKSFSLYGERVGALSVVTRDASEATRVLSQLKRVIRTNYSNPPTHGAALVSAVLHTPDLRNLWESELATMRERIHAMRLGLLDSLKKHGVRGDFSFVARQRGMFSYSGLSPHQVDRLRDEFAIYAVSTGRICLAALNPGNLERVAQAIAQVLHTDGPTAAPEA